MDTESEQKSIVAQLEILNEKMTRQSSIKSIFGAGIIHGIGFFIGSAIIATIALGILGPWFAEIDWVRETFERGASIVE